MRLIARVTLAIIAVILLLHTAPFAAEQSGIPPKTVADYLRAVIEADRTFYTIHVVERLQRDGGSKAVENWRAEKNTLPLPAQFLMEASDLASKTGMHVRYRLISLWPINPHNRPRSESEKSGLTSLAANPDDVVTATIRDGDESYFQAIYPDRAVSQSCIGCHNSHPRSPKKNFKLHEAMGGLVIEIPLGR